MISQWGDFWACPDPLEPYMGRDLTFTCSQILRPIHLIGNPDSLYKWLCLYKLDFHKNSVHSMILKLRTVPISFEGFNPKGSLPTYCSRYFRTLFTASADYFSVVLCIYDLMRLEFKFLPSFCSSRTVLLSCLFAMK